MSSALIGAANSIEFAAPILLLSHLVGEKSNPLYEY